MRLKWSCSSSLEGKVRASLYRWWIPADKHPFSLSLVEEKGSERKKKQLYFDLTPTPRWELSFPLRSRRNMGYRQVVIWVRRSRACFLSPVSLQTLEPRAFRCVPGAARSGLLGIQRGTGAVTLTKLSKACTIRHPLQFSMSYRTVQKMSVNLIAKETSQ